MDAYLVMAAAALNGIGGSTILVLSLSLTADLIDQNTVSDLIVENSDLVNQHSVFW